MAFGSDRLPELICLSEVLVVWTAAALRRDPVDNLVWIHDVARLAVHTVTGVNLQVDAMLGARLLLHFVYRSWTEVLAWVAVFFHAARRTKVGR